MRDDPNQHPPHLRVPLMLSVQRALNRLFPRCASKVASPDDGARRSVRPDPNLWRGVARVGPREGLAQRILGDVCIHRAQSPNTHLRIHKWRAAVKTLTPLHLLCSPSSLLSPPSLLLLPPPSFLLPPRSVPLPPPSCLLPPPFSPLRLAPRLMAKLACRGQSRTATRRLRRMRVVLAANSASHVYLYVHVSVCVRAKDNQE